MAFIEIPVSNSILSIYNTVDNSGLFRNRGTELEPNWFFHLPFQGNQTRRPDNEVTIHKGINTDCIEIVPKLPFLQIETRDARVAIADVLEEIREEATNNIFDVYDWAYPRRQDRAQGYTIRKMTLKQFPIEALGAVIPQKPNLALGWRIQLEGVDYDS